MKFEDMIGDIVVASVPLIHPTKWQKLKIHGAEAGGIWVESQELINIMLKNFGVSVAPKTTIFFLPFHQIAYAMCSIEEPSLSEKAFGV